MSYALVPGRPGDATREGLRFTCPSAATRGRCVEPLVRVEPDGVVVSAVKLADDGSDDIVVRLRGSGCPGAGPPRARLPGGLGDVTDLLERPLPAADGPAPALRGGGVDLACGRSRSSPAVPASR